MKIFKCSECGQVVYFENVSCIKCGHRLAFLPDLRIVSPIEPVASMIPSHGLSAPQEPSGAQPRALFVALSPLARGQRYRLCDNGRLHQVCNWAVPESDPHGLCRACRLNTIIPNLSDVEA